MQTNDLVILAVTLVILGEVTYLLSKMPRTTLKTKQRAILIDTSVLMDGRIIAIAATGFLGGTLVIPRSVVGELQFLADNADADKRSRARHGLDVVSELQKLDGVDVELLQDDTRATDGVDNRLLELAKQHGAAICTLDFNLTKVAIVEDIKVLNLNELAQSLRMAHLPGEETTVEIIQKGQDAHQGVGYLADGTMVVVENASSKIGSHVHIEVVRSLQTTSGRMMFAKIAPSAQGAKPAGRKPQPAASSNPPQKDSHTKSKPTHVNRKPMQTKPSRQKPTAPKQQRTDRTQPAKPAARKKPVSSKAREAAFINLVNSQD